MELKMENVSKSFQSTNAVNNVSCVTVSFLLYRQRTEKMETNMGGSDVMELKMENVSKSFQSTNAVNNVSCVMKEGIYGLLGINGSGKTTMMRMLCTLKMENVSKSFQSTNAVNNVSCVMKEGIYGLLGINGSGKTTMMRMLCTLLSPTEGKITYNGKDIFSMDGEYRKLLGYLPQEFGYYPDFTVWDYLLYISSVKGLRPAEAKKRAGLLIKQVGLSREKNKKMKRLSGGMKRRVGIAQAMLNDPKILILDEPTAGLDPNERIRFRSLLSEFSQNRLVLLSTHIVSDIEYIADSVFLMKEGEIKRTGTVEELTSCLPAGVWECTVNRKEAEFFVKNYKISNIRRLEGKIKLRVLSEEKPRDDAVLVTANLEDVFLYYFGRRAGGADGEI